MGAIWGQVPLRPIRCPRLGDYEAYQFLGRGGTASVYACRHAIDGSPAAVKILHPHLGLDRVVAERFLREARHLSRIAHPNVVEVLDVGEHEGAPFLVMSLIDGEDLSDHIRRFPSMSMADIAECMLPVIDAVAAAHKAGVVHRDLKPSNIRISRDRGGRLVPKVLDFGVSKLRESYKATDLTESGEALGTVGYMAPEQVLSARHADERSDVYALGAILYECATARRPFQGRGPYELMHAILTSAVPPPRSHRSDIPQALEDLVIRAMRRDPERRFSTADELGRALAAVASGRAAPLKPASASVTRPTMSSHAPMPGTERERMAVSARTDCGSKRVRTLRVGRVFLVYWFQTPKEVDLREVISALGIARASYGAPLVGCAYTPEFVDPPAASVRLAVRRVTPQMLESCESIHTVQAGLGVAATAFRAVGRAMVIAGGFGRRIFIHNSLDDFFLRTQGTLHASLSQIRREIERIEAEDVTGRSPPTAWGFEPADTPQAHSLRLLSASRSRDL